MSKAILALEDGCVFYGDSFGAAGEISGEVVFNTAMTGYQEILTDPSYRGQIVTMTYPEIGNYGINPEDMESRHPFLSGFIVRENSRIRSNWRSTTTLNDYLAEHGIVGICEIDTRELTRHIRDHGAKKGIISTVETDAGVLVDRAAESRGLVGVDLAKEVTCETPWEWEPAPDDPKPSWNIAVLDFGVKYNILRQLSAWGARLKVYPASTPVETLLQDSPDGVFLSNGPGDPSAVNYAIDTVGSLMGRIPLFGICLGHQITALAAGAQTFKMKFGHHGANHPVQNLDSTAVEITSQNHGFAVDKDTMNGNDLILTHLNLNDQTVEGLKNDKRGYFSVQYHPEASPGPHDSYYLFETFTELIRQHHA
jgi:carbamoyl-phosphate synthase small subunit